MLLLKPIRETRKYTQVRVFKFNYGLILDFFYCNITFHRNSPIYLATFKTCFYLTSKQIVLYVPIPLLKCVDSSVSINNKIVEFRR